MVGLTSTDIVPLLGAVLSLVVLEGLLSADNALVLAVMVRHLPRQQQKRALRYGIVGAFVFRFIAVIFAATLLHYWALKVLGGLYLLGLAIKHLLSGEEDHAEESTKDGASFWATVVNVELADIIFSIDSILAAVALAEGLPDKFDELRFGPLTVNLWVVYFGGILGILTMRYVAGLFLILLRRFTGLATGAYVLVAWIGAELVGSGLSNALHPRLAKGVAPPGWHARVPEWVFRLPLQMPEWFFWSGMGLIVVLSLLYRPRAKPAETEGLAEVARQQDEEGVENPSESDPLDDGEDSAASDDLAPT